MIYALFIAGPICHDLRAFGGTNQAKKFAVGGPQLILRAGCLELVYLLAVVSTWFSVELAGDTEITDGIWKSHMAA